MSALSVHSQRRRRMWWVLGACLGLALTLGSAQPPGGFPAAQVTTPGTGSGLVQPSEPGGEQTSEPTAVPSSAPPTSEPTATPVPAALPPDQLAVGTEPLASGLGRLTAIAAPDDGSNRLLVTEKSGTVQVFRLGQGLAPGAYLDISDRVSTAGNERGLLGIATAPDFATSRTLVVAYTRASDGALTLSRFRLASAGQESVPADSEQVLLTQSHGEFGNHNGGQVAFGPDGLLYWGLGDGGGGGDPLASGQDLGTLLGKIVRIDALRDCAGLSYCVPADNPFVGRDGARSEIWAFGLRNPWRFSFDPSDGSLWIADVGQNRLEEVDVLTDGGRGANLGWSCREGDTVFDEDRCPSGGQLVDPVFTYPTGEQGCAVQGGFVYRGQRYASIATGVYVLGDYCTGNAWGIARGGDSFDAARMGSVPEQTTTFGVDQAGELYLATDNGELRAVTFARR